MTPLHPLWHDGDEPESNHEEKEMIGMTGKRLIAALCAILLPLVAAAESAVEILPTTPPMPDPVTGTSEYSFEDLDPYYEPYGAYMPYMLPRMSGSEKLRFAEIQARTEAGEKPDSSVLNKLEDVTVSLIQLPREQYEGEDWYLILPCRELTDSELAQIAGAFLEAGIRFDPDLLNWRNCMRGGAITETRGWKGDERERYFSLGEQFNRSGLRPETPFTAAVEDDGIGRVRFADDPDSFNGPEYFNFLPARRLTDAELLQIYALDNPEPAVRPDEISKYETQLRRELSLRLGMPASAVYMLNSDYSGESDNYWGDSRTVYSACFEDAAIPSHSWLGEIELSSGKLIQARTDPDPRVLQTPEQRSDIRMDPWDPRWSEIARETIAALCTDPAVEIAQIQPLREASLNQYTRCAEIRVILTDGAVYQADISFLTGTVVLLEYYDAESAARLDYYNDHAYAEEGAGNE